MTDRDRFQLTDSQRMRVAGHLNLIQRLASMVAGELTAFDSMSEEDSLMLMAQVFIACGAHTAVAAVREHAKREPDYWNWKASCDDAFRRAVGNITDLDSNIPGQVAI